MICDLPLHPVELGSIVPFLAGFSIFLVVLRQKLLDLWLLEKVQLACFILIFAVVSTVTFIGTCLILGDNF